MYRQILSVILPSFGLIQICCGILANLVVHLEGSAAVVVASNGALLDLLASVLLCVNDPQVRRASGGMITSWCLVLNPNPEW